MIFLTCSVCGNVFTLTRQAGRPPTTCSDECRVVDRAAWRKANPAGKQAERDVSCQICGEPFTVPRRPGRIPATCGRYRCQRAFRNRYIASRRSIFDSETIEMFNPDPGKKHESNMNS